MTPVIPAGRCGCSGCRVDPDSGIADGHDLMVQIEAVAALGDWQGPEPSMGMIERSTEWRGQWLASRGTREKWTHCARVALLGLRHDLADGDTARVEKTRRLVDVYSAAAVYAPASVWIVVSGVHEQWHEPADRTEDDVAIDEDGNPIALLAGPFPTEEAAADYCVAHDFDDRDTSMVPRLPWSSEA